MISSNMSLKYVVNLSTLLHRRGLGWKQVLSNLVNYKSFGFTKINPRLPADKFEAVVQSSVNKDKALSLWNQVTHLPITMNADKL